MKFISRKISSGILLCVATMLAPNPASGETVSQKAASRMAQTFFNAINGQVMGKPNLVYNGKKLTTDHLFSPFYIYNLPAGGFVIISAENKAMPILGYSRKSNFDPENMTDATKALLTEYARDIEHIRYDSRIPEEAIDAWNNFNSYVASIIAARYDATDPTISQEEASEMVGNMVSTGRFDELSSDIYTPMQWQEMVEDELSANGSVAIGIVDGDDVVPAIVHGRKGDYFRMELGERNDWLMRLMATEFLSAGQLADLNGNVMDDVIEEEDTPFAFYDDFLVETQTEKEARQRAFDEMLIPVEPVVRNIGGGDFEIMLPEDVVMARVYNLQGAQVETLTFRGTNTAVIKLSHEPKGFYFALLNGESGKPYGIKLYK